MTARAAQMVVGSEDHARRLGDAHHLGGVFRRHRQRLFAKHVLSGGDGCHRLVEMLFVGGGDVNGINGRIGQRFLEIGAGSSNAVLGRIGGSPLGGTADDADDLAALLGPECRDHVLRGDRARTYKRPAHGGLLQDWPFLFLERSYS